MTKSGKGKSALKFILLFLGILLLLWYLAPLASGIFNVGNAIGILASVFLVCFGFAFYKIPDSFRTALLFFMAASVAVVILPLSVNMAKYANYKENEGVPTVIVLGCKVNGTAPSKYLYDRCRKAYDYLENNPNAVAVLSGGQGPDEGISEAECMKNVLVELGIDENRLYQEDKSTNTRENLEFSLDVIEKNSLSRDVLIVTNEFHEYRAKLICDRLGLNFHSSCSNSSLYTFLTFYTRELMGLVKIKLFGA